MLKASELKLMDGTTMENVELIPSDDGLVVMDGEEVVHIMHHALASVTYTDAGSGHFVKGRALAMYYDDSEKIREILEEFGYELEELANFINESFEQNAVQDQEQKGGDNPYE